jgi:hypothetical protein
MPCLAVIITLLAPRVAIVLLWLFTGWFHSVFSGILWPVLGFLFLPTTLLWYSAVHHWFGGHWSLVPLIGLVVAILIDISPARGRRRRSEG